MRDLKQRKKRFIMMLWSFSVCL